MRVLFIAGSPRERSRSRRLVQHAFDHMDRRHPGHDLDLLDLSEEAPEPFRGFDAGYSDATREVVRRVERADAFVIGSPVFNGSYSAALKNVFEHVNYKALEDRVAGFMLVGGGDISFLQVRTHLAQLMAYFNVQMVTRAVYASAEDVDEGIPPKVARRVERLVDKVIQVKEALDASEPPEHAPEPRAA